MSKTRNEILEDLKKLRPDLSNAEAKQLLETLETYCELVIDFTLKHEDSNERE